MTSWVYKDCVEGLQDVCRTRELKTAARGHWTKDLSLVIGFAKSIWPAQPADKI